MALLIASGKEMRLMIAVAVVLTSPSSSTTTPNNQFYIFKGLTKDSQMIIAQ